MSRSLLTCPPHHQLGVKGSLSLAIQVTHGFAIYLTEIKSHWLPFTASLLSLIFAGLSVPELSGFCTLLIWLAENLKKLRVLSDTRLILGLDHPNRLHHQLSSADS